MVNTSKRELVPTQVTNYYETPTPDPILVQECRDRIRFGLKRAREIYGCDFQAWRKMERECVDNKSFLRLIINATQKGENTLWRRFKPWRMLEYTPQACVIKYGDKLFDPVTIAYAEHQMPLSIIKKIRG